MRIIGYSTGALAYSDFRKGLAMLNEFGVPAVELSALRMAEWEPLLSSIPGLDLSTFDYVSIHLPSSMTAEEEKIVAKSLGRWLQNYGWPLILHPDAITDWKVW